MAKATLDNTTPSRRAILAGTVALPALAVPSIAQASTDPIFALIERHKAAYRRCMGCVRVRVSTADPWLPDYDAAAFAAAETAQDTACEASRVAAFALTEVQPTTMASVLALLQLRQGVQFGGVLS